MKNWLLFIALAIIWGSSFFWQKLALQEIGPFQVVGIRFLLAFFLLLGLMWRGNLSFPRDARTWFGFFALSLIYSALPVFLTAWAGTRIDTSLGSILSATSPFFVILFSSFIFRDEASSPAKIIGTLIGFVGMMVIIGGDLIGATKQSDVLGQLAQIGASACYGLAPVMANRLLKKQHITTQSAALMLLADIVIWMGAFAFEPVKFPVQAASWAGLLWLAVLASTAANLIYFTLLRAWGATRSGMVSYAIPVVGLTIGALLGETISTQLILGGVLVLLGIAVVNKRH